MNSYVQVYKKYLQDTGQQDDRTDYQITQELGDWAKDNDPTLFEKHPDFAQEWSSIREANAPSLPAEAGRAFKRSGIGLGSTALGGAALITGSDYLKRKARALDMMASDPDLAPTIGTLEDIQPGNKSTTSKIFSRDALRYGLSKVGESVPSIGEAAALGLAGGAIGSAIEPGVGTVVGAAEGVAEGLLGRGMIKKAIQSLVSEGLTKEAIEEGLKKGVPQIVEAVTKNAKALAGARAGTAAAAANSYLLNAGEVYGENDDRATAAGLGLIAAIPDTVLPAIIVKKLFPGVKLSVATESAKKLVGSRAMKLAEAAGITGLEAGTEGFQQAIDIVARNLKNGRDAMTFTPADVKEMREAAITGAVGGGLAGAGVAFTGDGKENISLEEPKAEAAIVPPVAIAPPVSEAPVETDVISPVRRVMAMSPEQQASRVTELESRQMIGDEPQEYEILKKVAPISQTEEQITQPTTPNEPITQQSPVDPSVSVNETVVGQPPSSAPSEPKYIYTIQRPQQLGERTIPGYIQIDTVENGQNTESSSLEKLAEKGVNLPKPPESLPQGQYTLEQVQQAIAVEQQAAPTPVAPVATPPAPDIPSSPAPVLPVVTVAPTQTPTATPPQQLAGVAGSAPNIDSGVETAPTAAPVGVPIVPTQPILNQQGDQNALQIESSGSVLQRQPEAIGEAGSQRGGVEQVQQGTQAPQAIQEIGTPPAQGGAADTGVAQPSFTLPRSLAGAKPRWSSFELAFDSDLDEATYILAQTKPSESDAKYLGEVMRQTGMTEQQARDYGREVKARIKAIANSGAVDDVLTVPATGSEDAAPAMRTSTEPTNPAVQANRTQEFQAVMARLVSNGANVQVMSQELLAQQTGAMLEQQIAALEQRLAQATTAPQRDEINRQLDIRKQRMAEVEQMRGVTYNPYHIAIAMDDVMSADVNNLVTLLHEAAESLTMRLNPAQQGAVFRAVEAMSADINKRMQAAAQNTGATIASVPNPGEMLAESMAQKLAAEGIPESKSLADAIVRWVKEIYYRVAMAAQKAFGAEPNIQMALDWYENQLRRELGGDFDYSLKSLLDRFLPQSNTTVASKLTGLNGTPDGIVDFFDPVTQTVRQPMSDPTSDTGLDWNMKFQTSEPNPGESEGIPAPEAVARQTAAAYNDQIDWMEKLRLEIAPDMPPAEFYGIVSYGSKSPQEMLALLETRNPGVSEAKIGGDRMTDTMNKNASYQTLQFIRGLQAKNLNSIVNMQTAVKKAEESYTKHAEELNRLEPDVRNAEIHEGILKRKAKELVEGLVKSYSNGLKTASKLGGMMRTEEGLGEFDPMPKYYEQVFDNLLKGNIDLFKYVDAIAALDIPLSTMEPAEILKAIRDNAETSPALQELTRNKPLALTLATLASDSSRQFDQVQLRKASGSTFLEIRKDLEAIRNATEAQLREMMKTMDEKSKAKGLRQRLRYDYLLERRALQRASDRMAEAEKRISLLEKAKPGVAEKVAQSEQAIGGIYSDWRPVHGADFSVMRRNEDGSFSKMTRKLAFNQDGSATDADGILNDLAQNQQWLIANKDKAGQKEYNRIKTETQQLQALDVQRAYQAANYGKVMGFIDSFVRPLQAIAKQAGGAGSRIVQEFNQYEFINRSGEKSLKPGAYRWGAAWDGAMKSAGMKDVGQFRRQVYNPVMYYLGVNPGLDQSQAIREATKEARARLAKEPAADFNEKFEKLLLETKAMNDELLRTAEQYGVMVSDPKLQGELRRALARGWITGMRGMNDGLVVTLVNDMEKAGWNQKTFEQLIPPKDASEEDTAQYYQQLENPDALRGALAPYFTPEIVDRWLKPFINKPGESVFTHEDNDIPQLDLQNAWAKSNGDVVAWIDDVGARQGVKPEDMAKFRMDMIKQLGELFNWEAKMAHESKQTPDLFNEHGTKLHVMMDARVNDMLPAEHVDFAMYEPTSVQQILGQVAFHGAFGRNGQALAANLKELSNSLRLKKAAFDSLVSTTVEGRRREAKARGMNYDELKSAVKHWQDVEELRGEIESAFGLNNTYGPLHDARAGLELLGFMVGQAVDQPKTAGLNFLSLAARPFAMHSLGPKALKSTALSYGELAKNTFGGLLKDFGLDIIKMSKYAAETGEVEGKAFRRLPFGVILSGDMGKEGSFQDSLAKRFVVKPLRILKAIQKKGVGPGIASIPGLGTMSRFSTEGAIANNRGQVWLLDGIINAGINHFASHPEDLNNPAFRFTADNLKLNRDRGVYDWFRNKTVEYNMGPIENIVREAMQRVAAGDRAITAPMVEQLAQMNAQELDGASSINTAPAGLANNPALKVAMPLLRWPLWMMHAAHEGLADANGKADFKSMMRGIGRLAAWNLPLGLAFTFLIDEYDEKILGKKNAMPAAQKVGAIPFFGLPAALATTERGIPQELLAIGQRMIRSGNIYGLGTDLAGALVTPFDPGSGQRAFSLDQRVMVMSQLLNLAQATSNMVSQGGTATWGSVYRPMVASIGGNGMLNSLGVVNNMLGLDNAEARLTMRINAARWVNTAAKEIDLETKKTSGYSNPTPMSVWTREMQLAAMANDRMGFSDAYQKALAEARAVVAEDERIPAYKREQEAMQRVLASWKSRNPFSGLAATPTPDQINQLLSAMNEDGRNDVTEAMKLYHAYTNMIAPSKIEQQYNRRLNVMRSQNDPAMMINRLRRQAAGSMFAQ